jgi:hypothetical protein
VRENLVCQGFVELRSVGWYVDYMGSSARKSNTFNLI